MSHVNQIRQQIELLRESNPEIYQSLTVNFNAFISELSKLSCEWATEKPGYGSTYEAHYAHQSGRDSCANSLNEVISVD